jgi:hypothetical protein
MLSGLVIWGTLLVGLIFLVLDKRRGAGALVLAYFLLLSLGHVPGVLAYLNPNELEPWMNFEETKTGFDVTLIGTTAFIAGAIAARIMPIRTASAKAVQLTLGHDALSWLSRRVLTVGIAFYFVLLPVSGFVPSLTATISVGGELLILGIWFWIYSAEKARDSRQILMIFAMLPLLPLSTLVTGGFIGYGATWILSVAAFYFVIARRRIWFYIATPPVIFLGLSLFVTYAQQRDDIRELVWYQDSSIVQRLNQVSKLVTEFQFLDLSDEQHQFALDQRLNQNFLVGAGVIAHRQGLSQLWYGATVPLWAIVPRAIWPDKPQVGGSGDLVSEFTGIQFAEGTSIGIGQVLEFYMNFGMAGVLVGFAGFGFMLMRLDRATIRALAVGDVDGALKSCLPGLSLLMPLGSLMEILVSVCAALFVSQLLVRSKLFIPPFPQRPNTKLSGRTAPMTGRQ